MEAEHARNLQRGLCARGKALQHIGAVGDQRRQATRGPVPAMSLNDAAYAGLGRLVIEKNAAPAIDLHIDEAGREDCVGWKRDGSARSCVAWSNTLDKAGGYGNQCRPPQRRSVEQLRSGNCEACGGRRWVHDLDFVCVTSRLS